MKRGNRTREPAATDRTESNGPQHHPRGLPEWAAVCAALAERPLSLDDLISRFGLTRLSHQEAFAVEMARRIRAGEVKLDRRARYLPVADSTASGTTTTAPRSPSKPQARPAAQPVREPAPKPAPEPDDRAPADEAAADETEPRKRARRGRRRAKSSPESAVQDAGTLDAQDAGAADEPATPSSPKPRSRRRSNRGSAGERQAAAAGSGEPIEEPAKAHRAAERRPDKSAEAQEPGLLGRVTAHPNGYGFVSVEEEGGADVFLPPPEMRGVLHGDRVRVRVTGGDGKRREGELIEVVERSAQEVVGRLVVDGDQTLVVPENPRMPRVLLAPDGRGKAREGQVVVVRLLANPDPRALPTGRVTEVLGEHMAPGMEIQTAIRAHDIPHTWPAEVEREAETFGDQVSAAQKRGRKDLRDLPLVTIDGADARDFDDAVCAQRRRGGWRLWVAIADVSAYVTPGSALDVEAEKRGNSVYFPEAVVPMLPESLSNGLCSLNPKVDRLCMVCEMCVDRSGEVSSSRFFPAVMRSHARLLYEDVAALLDDPEGAPLAQRLPKLVEPLLELEQVFEVLLAARERRGAIDFESTEVKVRFGEDRKIEALVPVQRNRAHRLIEECMIAANVEAARRVAHAKVPAPYRVHEQPDPERLAVAREFLAARGLSLGGGNEPTPKDFAQLLAQAADREDSAVIQSVLLRSLMQARYSAEDAGHFGLALEHYAHFTSPIRRYPDLLLHRALRHLLPQGLLARRKPPFRYSTEQMEALCAHASMTERRADEAVRDVLGWLKCEYMQDRVGEVFDGIVTGVAGFGVFVELTGYYVDGMIHISRLGSDYFEYDARQHRLVGRSSGRRIGLGETLRVRLVRVSLDDRKIELEPADAGKGRSVSRNSANRGKRRR